MRPGRRAARELPRLRPIHLSARLRRVRMPRAIPHTARIRYRTSEVSRRLSGHPDQQPEVPESDLEQAPADQVQYPGQQDDDKDD